MKSYLSLVPVLLILFYGCSQEPHDVKSITWVSISGGEESIYKFERFNKNGALIYDSTLFISGMGYRINRYYNGKVIFSKAKIIPDILELFENEYDSQGNLISSKFIKERDTTIYIYRNKYQGNLLLDILIYVEGDTIPISIDRRSYIDSLLKTETTYKLSVDSFGILREKRYGYDERGRIAYVVISNYQQGIVDSSSINFELREKKDFRSINEAPYEMISVEKILKNDSSEIEIQQPSKNRTILIRRKKVEFW